MKTSGTRLLYINSNFDVDATLKLLNSFGLSAYSHTSQKIGCYQSTTDLIKNKLSKILDLI